MQEFQIFIASSKELNKEREDLKTFINQESVRYRNWGLDVKPRMWESESKELETERKQNIYNKLLGESDVVVFIFGKKIGKYTKEEFDKALKLKNESGKLKHIYTYFKDIEVKSNDDESINSLQEVINLKNDIEKNKEQVCDTFKNSGDLLLKIHDEFSKILIPVEIDPKLRKFNDLYNKINQPFQISAKKHFLDHNIANLQLFYDYNVALPALSEKDFYERCKILINKATKEETIKALSVMLKCEWNDSKEETEFWKVNLDAVNRCVNLERIFIVKKSEAHRLKTMPQIQNHIKYTGDYLKSYVVEREYLKEKFDNLLRNAGEGFILCGKKWVLLDKDPTSGGRGILVQDEKEIIQLNSIFDELKKRTVPLKEYIDNIPLSHIKKEMISIFVTTKCNLNCDYCFTNKNQEPHKNQTISMDFVKLGIDDYFKTDYMRHVRFFGAGEPTVEFELLKKIHLYALQKGGKYTSFEIQTNGAFIDDIAIWIAKNIDIVWISCDGTPEIQDKHRPCLNSKNKSSKLIEKNIKLLQNHGTGIVGIRATITNENVDRQIEMIDYFSQHGIEHIWVDPVFPSVSEEDLENNFDIMHFAERFYDACTYSEEQGIFYGSILTCNFGDCVDKHCRACVPLPHLTTDGFISACDMALFGGDNNHMQPFIYGKWDKISNTIKYDNMKIEILRARDTNNMIHCKKCKSKEHCGGYCLGEVLNEKKSLKDRKENVCEAIRFLDSKMSESQRKYDFPHP